MPLAATALALLLGACNQDADSITGKESPLPEPLTAGRFSVVDTVLGNWKVVSSDKVYPGDSVLITKDSLIWENNSIKTLRPTAAGLRFYAYAGHMGVTDGKNANDSILFEYFKRGDTLWLEYQKTTEDSDNKLDRTKTYCHALLPAKAK